jgi:hypothetical protein
MMLALRDVPTVLDVPDGEARDLYACDLCLIRPDQHVTWCGNAAPSIPARSSPA